jgi:hypothetical protein
VLDPTGVDFPDGPPGEVFYDRTFIIEFSQTPPMPTDKAQCKNDGWRSYAFKNEGDCVSFIATDGKNPPAG